MSETVPSSVSTNPWAPAGLPTLFDRYQILGVLGEGGMGTVFKGYHLSLKRYVAIKTLRIDRAAHPELVERFLWEVQAIGQMDHPNVVRATDAGEKNGVCYLVMEYLTGSDLSHLVSERGRLEAADACELARQAALGLQYIHRTLVHRDIKPSNLLLSTDGLVKILDLGLARLGEAGAGDRERTPQGAVLGTYAYMAPEQAAAGAPVDGRADIYSLGCTLFKLLTGRAPFSGPDYDSAAKQLYAHAHVPLTALDAFRSIPEDLRAVLLRMTAKAPAERYATAREVAEALAPLAAGAQPLRLLGLNAQGADPAVRPLPPTLPEELSRLAGLRHETPAGRGGLTDTGGAPRSARRRRALLAAGLLLAALAALAWFVIPALVSGPEDGDGAGPQPKKVVRAPNGAPRALDGLAPHRLHRLLDQPPLPVGCAPNDPRRYRWDADALQLDVKGIGSVLFLLGTTSRAQYALEAGVAQAPWTGNVGVFWGYREDAAAKQARTPGREFAWFQMVCIWHKVGGRNESLYSVRRGKGALSYDPAGELLVHTTMSYQHEVPLLFGGEKILALTVERNRLARALLGSLDLTKLYSAEANGAFASEPYQGGLGVFTLAHHATFSDVRFIAHSGD